MKEHEYTVEPEIYTIDGKKYQRIISPLGVSFYREIKKKENND